MKLVMRLAAVMLAALLAGTLPAAAQGGPRPGQNPNSTFSPDEIVNAGHQFFGNVSRGLASVVERAVSNWGLPNGYVLGEEGSGAFVSTPRTPVTCASTGRGRRSASTGAATALAP
jgi:hypothetical protein